MAVPMFLARVASGIAIIAAVFLMAVSVLAADAEHAGYGPGPLLPKPISADLVPTIRVAQAAGWKSADNRREIEFSVIAPSTRLNLRPGRSVQLERFSTSQVGQSGAACGDASRRFCRSNRSSR
jgi:hypothetical protein